MKDLKLSYIPIIIVAVLMYLIFFGPVHFLSGEKKTAYLDKFRNYTHFYRSVDANDNHRNWACHNYAHNLMMSCEPNSIFMTEGGDNQVFSLLYFSYVERKRPDVDFFDQKGNVFPRLYGDLMNTFPDDLNMIRDLRDFQLYSTGRPVYLTWKRPNLHKIYFANLQNLYEEYSAAARQNRRPMRPYKVATLAQLSNTLKNMVPREVFDQSLKNNESLSQQQLKYLGPWYYQRYGILYRVTPIRYAICDGLEIYKRASYSELKSYVRSVSQIDLAKGEFDAYVQDLNTEGLVRKTGSDQYALIKPQKRPYEGVELDDYWANYNFYYTNVPNSRDWDYLTREIFGNYNFQRATYCTEQHQKYRSKFNNDREKRNNMAFLRKSEDYHQETFRWFEQSCYYGHDMPSMHFNYALTLTRENRHDEAIKYYKNSAEMQDDFYQPYLNIGQVYMGRAQNGPVSEELSNLTIAQEHFKKAEERIDFSLAKRNKSDQLKNNQDYRRIQFQLRQIEGMIKYPRPILDEQKKKAAGNNPAEVKKLADVYASRVDFNNAVATYDKLIKMQPQNMYNYIDKFSFMTNYDPVRGHQVLEQMVQNWSQFKGVDIRIKLNYTEQCGAFNQQFAENLIQQRNYQQAFMLYQRAGYYFQMFTQDALSIQNDNTIRQRAIQMNRRIQQVQNRLEQLSKALGQPRG